MSESCRHVQLFGSSKVKRMGTAGGRAEGSGSTEEERGTRQHDPSVCDCDMTACWMWIAVSERKQILGSW